MEVFYEKAFWSLMALLGAFVIVFVRFYTKIRDQNLQIRDEKLEEKIRSSVKESFDKKTLALESKIDSIQKDALSIQRHESEHFKQQIIYQKRILKIIDRDQPGLYGELID